MSILQSICHKILFDWAGFRVDIGVELPRKCIIALAPHTSNWDFIIGVLYSRATGVRSLFLMKKEWFFWPVGILMRRLGGIPVYRNHRLHTTDIIAGHARKADVFRLCITPEGTRKANAEWKRGFYFIALKARIPILLYGLDYGQRRIVCNKTIYPDGDVERQMDEIKEYFKGFTARHPRKFIV